MSKTEGIRYLLLQRAAEDTDFRRRLVADPRAAIEEELGAKLPDGVNIRIVEETPDTVYLVLPPRATAPRRGDELSDSELETVAGGWDTGAGSGQTLHHTVTCSDEACRAG